MKTMEHSLWRWCSVSQAVPSPVVVLRYFVSSDKPSIPSLRSSVSGTHPGVFIRLITRCPAAAGSRADAGCWSGSAAAVGIAVGEHQFS